MIQWKSTYGCHSKFVVGIMLYKFAAELDLCCHWKLRENRASNLSVSSSKRNSPWYSATREIRSPAQLLSPSVTCRRDSCHCHRVLCSAGLDNASGRKIFAAVKLEATPVSRGTPPLAHRPRVKLLNVVVPSLLATACPNHAIASP